MLAFHPKKFFSVSEAETESRLNSESQIEAMFQF